MKRAAVTEQPYRADRKGDNVMDTVNGKCHRDDEELRDSMQGQESKGLVHISQYLDDSLEQTDQLPKEDHSIIGIPTGFVNIDRRTGGMYPANLIVIAARPGMGKTSFALNIAENAAICFGKKVAIFNLEMSGIQIANRLLSSRAEVSSEKLKKGCLSDNDRGKVADAFVKLSRANIYIDDTPNITVTEIGVRCRKLMLEHGLDLVVIDYLQLLNISSNNVGTRMQEITEISRTLKILANDLHIPIILLSQLSRIPEKGQREPGLSDLRDSGALVLDADVVMFLYREDYYKEDAEKPDKTKCKIAKNRNGEVGYEYLAWQGEYAKFSV